MRKFLAVAVACLAMTAGVRAQTPVNGPANIGNLLYASNFAGWTVAQGNNGPFAWSSPQVCTSATSGGVQFKPFVVGSSIRIMDSAIPSHSENVNITTVNITGSGCQIGTSTPAYQHYSFYLATATGGLQEAINYANQNFAGASPSAVVYATPAWSQIGGTTSMIVNAKGSTAVSIWDQRSSIPVPYTWNGSIYVAQPIGSNGITQLTGPVTAGPGSGSVATTITATGVTPGSYNLGGQAVTVNAGGQITAVGNPFSATFGCTQCGTYEIGYGGITAASGTISYANPSVPTSASVSDGTNTDTLTTPFTSWTLSHTYTTNTTFTLTAVGNAQGITPTQSIVFAPRSYGGTGTGGATGATASGTSAVPAGATGTLTNIGLGASCAGQSFTATTSGVQYVYYLSPCNVASPGGGSFTIPGPAVFPMNSPTSFTFTGQYGGTWTGYLYQSVNSYVGGTSYTIGVGN